MPRSASPAELAPSLQLLHDPGTPGWPLWAVPADDPAWGPLAELARAERWDPVAVRVAQRLGGAERRVADSLLLLGLAARLWYVVLAPAAAGLPVLDPACLLVSDDQGAVRLGVREPRGVVGAQASDLAELVVSALEPVLASLRLAPGLAWGNVASALLGVRQVVPGVSGLVVEVLAHDRLVGTVGPDGRRRSCCLVYRAGGGLCADCCLERVPSAGPGSRLEGPARRAGARGGAAPARP